VKLNISATKNIKKNKWRIKSFIKVATSDLCIVVYKTEMLVHETCHKVLIITPLGNDSLQFRTRTQLQ
jgi:hypothetical protein